MRIILTKKEYEALANAKENAKAEVRAECQAEFEKAKDEFLKALLDTTGIREAFAGPAGQSQYERWRDCTRNVVRNLNMPK